jgi:hypothetical protein
MYDTVSVHLLDIAAPRPKKWGYSILLDYDHEENKYKIKKAMHGQIHNTLARTTVKCAVEHIKMIWFRLKMLGFQAY